MRKKKKRGQVGGMRGEGEGANETDGSGLKSPARFDVVVRFLCLNMGHVLVAFHTTGQENDNEQNNENNNKSVSSCQ